MLDYNLYLAALPFIIVHVDSHRINITSWGFAGPSSAQIELATDKIVAS